jgi:hypothetical protein
MKPFKEFVKDKKEIIISKAKKAIASLLVTAALLSPMKANAVASDISPEAISNKNYTEIAMAVNKNIVKDHPPIKITADMIEGAVESNVGKLFRQNSVMWERLGWEHAEKMEDAGCFFLSLTGMSQIKDHKRLSPQQIIALSEFAHKKGWVGKDPRDGKNGDPEDMYVWKPELLASAANSMIKDGASWDKEDASWKNTNNSNKTVKEVGRFGPNQKIPAGKDWDFCVVKISSPIRIGKEHFVLADKNGKILLDPLGQRYTGHSSSLFSILYPDLPENKNGPNKGKYSEVYLYKFN